MAIALLATFLGVPGISTAQSGMAHAHGHTGIPGLQHDDAGMPAMEMESAGALGVYPMGRDASGTSWQPDETPHGGAHWRRGAWGGMVHAMFEVVDDHQHGPRGDDKTFLSGMVMAQGRRAVGDRDALQLRAMFSPDPLMGRNGYPLLLASGETADGVHPLVDRQHPHELVMELSATFRHVMPDRDAVFVYAGLPGEPAFGPPAFMHRVAIMDSPEAPITHHWLDSTHVAFGVMTLGYVRDRWKFEASRFNGREPDQRRYDIEAGPLDSSALRASWNPAPRWSLQASWARLVSPEQLAPGEDQVKWSASALYTRALDEDRVVALTLAWGRRDAGHEALDAWALEASVNPVRWWTLFARAERTRNDELVADGSGHGEAHGVSKLSVGAVRDVAIARHAVLGIGASYALDVVPRALDALYGDDPSGALLFVRLKVD
ncbi:MAG: hypothetical protein ACJ8GK_00955 [Luteimonas sp.]